MHDSALLYLPYLHVSVHIHTVTEAIVDLYVAAIICCLGSEIHRDGYTVNATKYEAVAFVDDSTMNIPGGSYLLTIEVIPVSLNISQVQEFFVNINGSGTESVDITKAVGASTSLVILRTVNPLPPGNHLFTVGLKPFSHTLTGTFTELKREVELWILSPTRT